MTNTARHRRDNRSIIAHHLIFPLYGHWAPNDLRGSGFEELYNDKFESLPGGDPLRA